MEADNGNSCESSGQCRSERVYIRLVASLGMGLHTAQFLQPQAVIIFLRKSRFLGQWLALAWLTTAQLLHTVESSGKPIRQVVAKTVLAVTHTDVRGYTFTGCTHKIMWVMDTGYSGG